MAMSLNSQTQNLLFDQIFALQQRQDAPRREGVMHVAAPQLPTGYAPIGPIQPLCGDREGYWIVYAQNCSYDVSGMLIYDETGVACFLTSQEAMYALFALLDTILDLTAECSDEFTNDHSCDIIPVWSAWSKLHYTQPEPSSPALCAWCWYEKHPDTPFPPAASSACCASHKPVRKGGAA